MEKLIIRKRQGIYALPLEEILYMEKELRKIRVYIKDISIEFYGRFTDVIPRLDKRFMCCHRSYIINMDKIVVMAHNTIFVENNDRIYLGNNSYRRAKEIFNEYISEKRGRS